MFSQPFPDSFSFPVGTEPLFYPFATKTAESRGFYSPQARLHPPPPFLHFFIPNACFFTISKLVPPQSC